MASIRAATEKTSLRRISTISGNMAAGSRAASSFSGWMYGFITTHPTHPTITTFSSDFTNCIRPSGPSIR